MSFVNPTPDSELDAEQALYRSCRHESYHRHYWIRPVTLEWVYGRRCVRCDQWFCKVHWPEAIQGAA